MPWAKIATIGAKALLKKDEQGKRKGLYILIGVLFIPFLVPVLALSLPGFFGKDSDDSTDLTFELMNSKLYQKVYSEYESFKSAVDNQISSQISAMQQEDTKQAEDNSKQVENSKTKNSNKKSKVSKKVKSTQNTTQTISITTNNTNINSVSEDIVNYAMAYIMNKYTDIQTKQDSFLFRFKLGFEIRNFYEDITTVRVWREGTAPNITYQSEVKILSAYAVGKKYFPDTPDQYETSYLAFGGMTENGDSDPSSNNSLDYAIGDLKYPESGMPIPHFKQGGDSPWANHIYGSGPMRQTACGPTSMAMIISYITGKTVLPPTLADWSMSHGYYVWKAGTSWTFYDAVAREYGLTSTQISVTAESISSHLKAGHPIIASMTPGVFTQVGHFIVLRGITPEGKILVNDPNDSPSKNFFNKEFDVSLIVSQCKGAWAFSK